MVVTMAKTARAAIEDLLTCESCHAFYYVERAEDGARTRLRCTSCGHSRDVLLSGAKTNKWTVIDPNGEVKTFTAWDDLVRSTPGSVVTAVRAKLPADQPISERAKSERPLPVEAAGPASDDVPTAVPGAVAANEPNEEERKSLSGAALLDVTPTPAGPKLTLADSSPTMPATESDKSIDVPMSEPALPTALESKPASLVEALVSSMPVAAPPPVEAKKAEQWDDEEAEVLSMRDIQVVPEARHSSTPPPPPRGHLKTLPPARPDALPPPTITFDDPKKSDPPPATAKNTDPSPPAKTPSHKPKVADAMKVETKKDEKSEKTDKSDESKSKKDSKKSDVIVTKTKEKEKDGESRTANTIPPKRDEKAKPAAATAKAQVTAPEEGGRSWLLPALGVAAAAGVVWYLASSSPAPQTNNTNTQPTTTATAPRGTTAPTTAEKKPADPTTTTTATAEPTTTAPTEKAATTSVKDLPKAADPTAANTGAAHTAAANTAAANPANPTTATGTEPKKPPVNANLSMSEALDKAGQAKRSGDYATARELYARVLRESASNAEAHAGLGDIARAQGDLAGAKASYQKALASSPDYGPALLSLADTEWDSGDRATAQAHYAKIVAARGGSAPERAKTRATP